MTRLAEMIDATAESHAAELWKEITPLIERYATAGKLGKVEGERLSALSRELRLTGADVSMRVDAIREGRELAADAADLRARIQAADGARRAVRDLQAAHKRAVDEFPEKLRALSEAAGPVAGRCQTATDRAAKIMELRSQFPELSGAIAPGVAVDPELIEKLRSWLAPPPGAWYSSAADYGIES